MRLACISISLTIFLATAAAAQTSASAKSYFERGAKSYTEGNLEGAIEEFGFAINYEPNLASAYLARAKARIRKGDCEGAAATKL